MKCFPTSSNAFLLTGELATLLTGRYFEIPMTPFSFAEYRSFIAMSERRANADENSPKLSKTESLANYLYFGGIKPALLAHAAHAAAVLFLGLEVELRDVIEEQRKRVSASMFEAALLGQGLSRTRARWHCAPTIGLFNLHGAYPTAAYLLSESLSPDSRQLTASPI